MLPADEMLPGCGPERLEYSDELVTGGAGSEYRRHFRNSSLLLESGPLEDPWFLATIGCKTHLSFEDAVAF